MGRLTGIATFLFALFTLLILQFYKIQVIEGDKWQQKAEKQHQFSLSMPGKRGVFYSNPIAASPKPLVIDVSKYHIYIDPGSIPEEQREAIALSLTDMVDGDYTFVRAQFDKRSRSRRIATWVSRDRMVQIEGWWKTFSRQNKLPTNAVFYVQDWKRSYPYGSLLGQVLHTVRENHEPTGGVESYFNRYLQGASGKRVLMRSPRHSLEADKVVSLPVDGADVYLTIDPTLQAIAEQEIAKAAQRVHAKAGWAVMMDPQTGEILALAQYPFFEPKHYAQFYNHPELTEHTKVKAITDCFEPGSTIKPITVALALLANEELRKRGEKPLFSPDEKIRSDDGLIPGTHHRIRDVSNHRFLNMELAILKSSNVYMGKLAERICTRLGPKWYADQLKNIFGFGFKTNIELPAEAKGLIPNPNNSSQWSKPTPYTLSIGYNMLATSLQMTRAFAIIANGGYDVKPTILRQIKRGGSVLVDNAPKRLERKLPAGISEQLISALKYVTKPGGSGTRADIRGYTEAGKSGTSEKIIDGKYDKKIHFSSFIGFAPANDARFVLFIGIDEPEYRFIPGYGKTHFGGKCAAPAFREIAKRSLAYLGVAPDDPHGYPVGDPRYNPDKADSLIEAKALKELYDEWNN
ncbi:MAG: penicillin-binding protein 2 [Chlamydiia bacterium]|nr:penicillin-binding protein 2 [Chlamydiia bacterium]